MIGETEATLAVEAAAEKYFETVLRANMPTLNPWADQPTVQKHEVRQLVLPLVWAALEAVPAFHEADKVEVWKDPEAELGTLQIAYREGSGTAREFPLDLLRSILRRAGYQQPPTVP